MLIEVGINLIYGLLYTAYDFNNIGSYISNISSGPKGLCPLAISDTFVSEPGFNAPSNFTPLSSLGSLDLNEFLEPSRDSLSARLRWTLLARVVARVLRCDTTRSARPLSWTLSALDSARTP